MSPLRLCSFTSPGTARERSRSACSQSNRAAAMPRTVSTRAFACASKSAYGFSFAAACVAASACTVTSSRSACFCLTEFPAST
jgi:hypothetical protein